MTAIRQGFDGFPSRVMTALRQEARVPSIDVFGQHWQVVGGGGWVPVLAPWERNIRRRRNGHEERHGRGERWWRELATIRYVQVGAVVLG